MDTKQKNRPAQQRSQNAQRPAGKQTGAARPQQRSASSRSAQSGQSAQQSYALIVNVDILRVGIANLDRNDIMVLHRQEVY